MLSQRERRDKMYGLKLISLISKVEQAEQTFDTWSDLLEYISKYVQDGLVVIYLNYRVMIGRLEKGNILLYRTTDLSINYLLQIRAFNKDKEVLIWKKEANLFGVRVREDRFNEENPTDEAVRAHHLLCGKVKRTSENWVLLREERGTELVIPYSNELEPNTRMFLETINYIKYNELGQASYEDCRFVGFEKEGVTDGES